MAEGSETSFMMGRALSLILSDLRARPLSGEGSVRFDIDTGPAAKQDLFFRQLILLLNLFVSLQGFCRHVLPGLQLPFAWVSNRDVDTSGDLAGRIDWNETFKLRQRGRSGYVKLTKRKEVARRELDFVCSVLSELLTHARVILCELEKHVGPESETFLAGIGAEIRNYTRHVERLVKSKFSGYFEEALLNNKKIEDSIKRIMRRVGEVDGPVFEEYRREVVIEASTQNFVPHSVEVLNLWRSQYLACDVWLSPGSGYVLRQVGTSHHLYEMWAFFELIYAARELGLGKTVQRTFIADRRSVPEFNVGSGRYAYFDFGVSRFRKSKALREVQRRRGKRGVVALPGTHVEWFIQNTKDFRDSIVIDTKYRSWDSGEALKVLGYAANFGVRNAVLILRGSIPEPVLSQGEVIGELCRITCPMDDPIKLWILPLIPDDHHMQVNRQTLSRFLVEAFLKGRVDDGRKALESGATH